LNNKTLFHHEEHGEHEEELVI